MDGSAEVIDASEMSFGGRTRVDDDDIDTEGLDSGL
jgi:hypothetical protein